MSEKDSVNKLKIALVKKKDKIRSAPDDKVYDIIDKIMKKISKSDDISGQELHDKWVDEYDMIPDKWIMKESYKAPKVQPKGMLNIFDIDDTLFQSEAHVNIMKKGKLVKQLMSGEFNTYKLKDGEEYDFTEFRSGEHFYKTAKPIDKMIVRAQRAVAQQDTNSRTIIVTARSDFKDKEPFLQKFRDHGFPIDQVYIERSGNLQKLMKSVKTPVTKAVVIRKYINSGKYNKIRMWDDHEGNLDILVKLSKLHPEIKIEAYLVDPDTGNTTRYDR